MSRINLLELTSYKAPHHGGGMTGLWRHQAYKKKTNKSQIILGIEFSLFFQKHEALKNLFYVHLYFTLKIL